MGSYGSLLFDDGFPPPLRLLNDSYTDRVKDTPRTSGSDRVGQRELAKTRHPMAETTNTYIIGCCDLALSLPSKFVAEKFNFILYVYINLYLRILLHVGTGILLGNVKTMVALSPFFFLLFLAQWFPIVCGINSV